MTTHIFLADDHCILLEGLHLLLDAQPNLNVVGEANNGHDAVQQVLKLQPDVALLDINMPELNGIEATRQIVIRNAKTKIIILSMHTSNEHIYQALYAGAQGYILKGCRKEELLEAIATVLAGERYLSRKISNELINDYLVQRAKVEKETPLAQLNEYDREIIQLVAEGKSSAMIAESLSLSKKTVDAYRSRLMQHLGLTDLPSLVKFAILHGITSLQ